MVTHHIPPLTYGDAQGTQSHFTVPAPALGASPVTDLPQAVIQGSHFFLGGHRCCLPCKIPPQQPRTQGTALGGACGKGGYLMKR